MPLSALMAQALVAFTIEFDNEFEHRMPHRTTNHGSTPGAVDVPWLVSMAMWVHCMRYVPADGIRAVDLARRIQLPAKSVQMIVKRLSSWWGYLQVAADAADDRAKPTASTWLVRPTRAGSRAQQAWEPLSDLITDRWRSRFGDADVEQLRDALGALERRLDVPPLDFLPIGEISRSGRADRSKARAVRPKRQGADLPLAALLSRVLLSYTLDFEADSDLPLALSANVMRVLDGDGVRVRSLPAATGIGEMGVANSLSTLQRRGYLTVAVDPAAGRARVARLTATGRDAQTAYRNRVAEIERDWESQFGTRSVRTLRHALETLVGGGTARDSPLFGGLEPHADGWRSMVPRADTLPHYPIVSHRGGFPDGS